MEYAVASQWLLRVGVLVLVVGIGFFLKYSIERGLLGPLARVALSVITGLVLLDRRHAHPGKKISCARAGPAGGRSGDTLFQCVCRLESFPSDIRSRRRLR